MYMYIHINNECINFIGNEDYQLYIYMDKNTDQLMFAN